MTKESEFNELKKQHEDVFKNADVEAVGDWMQSMTTAEKANKVFDSGLAFKITNKPVRHDYLWDVKIFWAHMEYNGKDVVQDCDPMGFDNLDECLNDCIKYIKYNFK